MFLSCCFHLKHFSFLVLCQIKPTARVSKFKCKFLAYIVRYFRKDLHYIWNMKMYSSIVVIVGAGNAPHVYLSSGPSGRGGYWAIDEHSRYVWYHYVAPDHFVKDETTAIDVDQARRSHYHREMNETSESEMTGELRRRPGRVRYTALTNYQTF